MRVRGRPNACTQCGRLVIPIPGLHVFLEGYQIPRDVAGLATDLGGYAHPACIAASSDRELIVGSLLAWQVHHLGRMEIATTDWGCALARPDDNVVVVIYSDARQIEIPAATWLDLKRQRADPSVVRLVERDVLMLVGGQDLDMLRQLVSVGVGVACSELLLATGAHELVPRAFGGRRALALLEAVEPHSTELARTYWRFDVEVELPVGLFLK